MLLATPVHKAEYKDHQSYFFFMYTAWNFIFLLIWNTQTRKSQILFEFAGFFVNPMWVPLCIHALFHRYTVDRFIGLHDDLVEKFVDIVTSLDSRGETFSAKPKGSLWLKVLESFLETYIFVPLKEVESTWLLAIFETWSSCLAKRYPHEFSTAYMRATLIGVMGLGFFTATIWKARSGGPIVYMDEQFFITMTHPDGWA